MKKRAAGLLVLTAILIAAVATPTASNVWSLATGRGFFIPDESSVFSFRVTKENEGSGEWWLYGEDGRNLFAIHPGDPVYLSVPRERKSQCPNFDPLNQSTWCAPNRHPVPDR
jgi:hypothetical protein